LKRECSLNLDKEKEYAKQGYLKEKHLKTANETIITLEVSLSKFVQNFEVEKVAMLTTKQTQLDESLLECDGLKHLIKIKNKELRTLRRLSKEILDQRTEVEQFFIEALEQIKNEKLLEKQVLLKARNDEYRENLRQVIAAQKQAMDKMGHIKFPEIRAQTVPTGGQNSQAGGPTKGSERPRTPEIYGTNYNNNDNDENSDNDLHPDLKVDLNELSLDDRENVLRLLFAKINNIQTRVNIIPQHTLAPTSSG
ncbi:unnamed protein product, partial [marine sediment metagenome]